MTYKMGIYKNVSFDKRGLGIGKKFAAFGELIEIGDEETRLPGVKQIFVEGRLKWVSEDLRGYDGTEVELEKCLATTKEGEKCRRKPVKGKKFCKQHLEMMTANLVTA